jgi:hypothetical protein
MKESYMRADRAIAVGAWILVFKIAGWTLAAAAFGWIGDEAERLVLIALIPMTGLAAVLQVRLYAVRVCSLVRLTSGLESGQGGELRSVR